MLMYIMRQYPKESCKEQTRLGAKYHLQRGELQMAREFIVTMMDNDTYNQVKKEIMDEIIGVEMQLASSSRSKMKKTLCIFSKLMTKN